MKKLIITILLTLSFTISLGSLVSYAGVFTIPVIPRPDTIPGPDINPNDPLSGRKTLINTILPNYAVGLIGFVGAATFVFLVISGVRYAMSFGNEEAIKKAKDQTIYALVGFVIALLSYTIVTIITNLKFEERTSSSPPAEAPADGSNPDE